MAAPDWLAIEGAYRAGQKSVNSIAKEQGTNESTIRSRAKKKGWVRDPAASQREKVKAHFAGFANGAANVAVREIEAAAARAIAAEELALTNAELALRHVHLSLSREELIESADLKRLSETNQINLAVIRTIFTLNDPDHRDGVGYDELPFPD
jgi:hypothetical protein